MAAAWGLLLQGPPTALAQEAGEAAPMAAEQMAKELFQQGRKAYDAGNYQQALDRFQAAYQRSPRPKLLFNIGQAADRLRMDELALSSFRQYLDELPQAGNREQVQNRVRALEQVIAERQAREAEEAAAARDAEAAAEAGPEPTPAQPEQHPSIDRELPLPPLLIGGAGLVGVGVGAVVGIMAKADEDDYAEIEVQSERDARRANAKFDSAETKALTATILMVAGGVVVAGAAAWLALELGDGDEQPLTATPLVGRDLAGLQLSGRFGGSP